MCSYKTQVSRFVDTSLTFGFYSFTMQVDVENSGVMSKLLGAGAVMVGQLFMLRIATIVIFLLHYSHSALQKKPQV